MDIHQLRTFVCVVNQGSFAAAARQLDVAPSGVTRAVAALERELGVRLMQRTTRLQSLTEAGCAYHEHAKAALEALERAEDEAKAMQSEVSGSVRLTASVAFGHVVVLPLLPALHRAHPGIQLEVLLTDSLLDLVADRVDVALRIGPAADSSLVGTRLMKVSYRVVASPAYLAAHGRPTAPPDLRGCDCLRFPLGGSRTEWKFRDKGTRDETVVVGGWLALSTPLAVHRAALEGLGPALLPDWLVSFDIAAGRLVDLFVDHEVTATSFDTDVWSLYPSRSHLPRRVRAVLDFIKCQMNAHAHRT
jgi:DNA-binding transcriptional LysR family regulator